MSRLDSVIRRLTSHRAAIDWAAEALAGTPGDVLECGLGNGRTYDHLRERMPDRRIWVIDRQPKPHPTCWPPEELLLRDEAEEALARLRAQNVRCALINYDFGSGDPEQSEREAARLTPLLGALLTPGGVILSVQPMPEGSGLETVPSTITGGAKRIFTLRRTA